jgi:uncharacterized protein
MRFIKFQILLVPFLISTFSLFANPESEKSHKKRNELKDKAIQGDIDAMAQLGSFYSLNDNDVLAIAWFKKAAEKDHKESLVRLTKLAHKDRGEIDYSLLEWAYLKLRLQGSFSHITKLAQIYADPDTPLYNKNKALLFFEEATQAKYDVAFLELGKLFMGTKVFKADFNRAARLFQKGAKHGNKEAMYLLAHCYHNGLGIEQNLKLTWKWYGEASQRGHVLSMFTIAEAMYYGNEREKNLRGAIRYYKSAARLGHRKSIGKLKELNIKYEEK